MPVLQLYALLSTDTQDMKMTFCVPLAALLF